MSQRYFLTTESTYEALRLGLDADLGYPKATAVSIFTPALEAPRDSLRRIVLAVDDALPHYAEIIAKVEPLLASASAQELTEAEYLAFLVCVSEGGGVPLAHAASHAAGGADAVFDQGLNTTDDPTFNTINAVYGGTLVSDQGGAFTVSVASNGVTSCTVTLTGQQNSPPYAAASLVISAFGITFPNAVTFDGTYDSLGSKPTLGTAAAAATSDFAAASHNHAASAITSGTLSDSRLSANVRQASDNLIHPFLLAGM